VQLSLEGFNKSEVKILKLLQDAAILINALFVDVFDHNSFEVIDCVEKLLKCDKLTSEEYSLIFNYRAIFALQNGPYTLMPRTNIKLNIKKERLVELLGFGLIFFFQTYNNNICFFQD
jgi:hypothetical protein